VLNDGSGAEAVSEAGPHPTVRQINDAVARP